MGVARQKWPEELHEVDDYPRTASGKVQKQLVREGLRRDIAICRDGEYRSHK
jgi:acyl-CoA synthetase